MRVTEIIIVIIYFVLQRYLIPQAQKNSGVTDEQVTINEDALNVLIKSYCRESGVRNLQKRIEKVDANDVAYG